MPYYVIDERNCFFEGMTKEETVQAIADATGLVPADINVDDAVISQIRETNKGSGLKFWIGTQAEYNALDEIVPNTFYIFTDGNELEAIEEIAQDAAASEIAGVNARVTAIDERTAVEDGVDCWKKDLSGVSAFFAQGSFIQFHMVCGVVFVYAGLIMPTDSSALEKLRRTTTMAKMLDADELPEKYRPQNRCQFLLGNVDAQGPSFANLYGDCEIRVNEDGSAYYGSILDLNGNRGESAIVSNLGGKRFFYQFSYLPKILTQEVNG